MGGGEPGGSRAHPLGRDVHVPGTPIRVEMTKWGGAPHWEFDGLYLGRDQHGSWLGFPRGTRHARPGFAFDSEVDSVTLVPHEGWWAATFHAPGIWCATYIDVATPARWEGRVLRAIDLDLDVVCLAGSELRVYVDDEDEFTENQAVLGYPPDVVAAARRACALTRQAVEVGDAPFDDATAAEWLTCLAAH